MNEESEKQKYPLPGEKPIEERRVLDVKAQQHRKIAIYQSQLDALVEKARQRPDVIEKMREEQEFFERDPEGYREHMMKNGLSYSKDFDALEREVGIDASVYFFSLARNYVGKKIGTSK